MDLTSYAGHPEGEDPSAFLDTLLCASLVAEREAQPPRPYLGGSRLGVDCDRRLGYEYTKVPVDPGKGFSGRLYRIFQRGHDGEARMAAFLRLAGFDLVTEKEDGNQFGFYTARDRETGEARIAGHLDGVIRGVRPHMACTDYRAIAWAYDLPFPMLWEMKELKNSSFNGLKNKKLKTDKPVYYAQVQVYMAYMQLTNCLFTAENADTCEVYAEIVPFVPREAQAASDRGVRVISAARVEDLARCARDETDFRCRGCPFAERCWTTTPAAGTPMKVAAPAGWGAWS